MMKAAFINSSRTVENIVVWDDTCVAPENYSVIVLDDDVIVSIGWLHTGDNTFIDPIPLPVEPSITPPTISELQAQLNALQLQIQALSGGQ